MSFRNQNADDTRVMSLVFDNSGFEPNAKESLSTLKKLKGALNESTKITLFEDINRGVRSVTMEPLVNGLDTVYAKFSLLTSMSDQFKRRMADSIYDFVSGTVKNVTVDQLTAGWQKYEEKTEAVQSIMAGIADEWADQERRMAYVNEQLEKMNWFTDETSYNFVDMTSNVGKFINSGVGLEDSVTAMEGISNWAAISGANAQQASRAMYNLSQAMGTGTVKLQDWMSIENAQMATMDFKNTVLETGVAMGLMTDEGNGVYKTLSGLTVTAATFRDDMKEGWFTSDLLVETLKKYGAFTDRLHKTMQRFNADITTSQVLEWTEAYAKKELDVEEAAELAGVSAEFLRRELEDLSSAEYEFGMRAFKAAQEAKTFTDAINATKDAASSAWMNIYETLFGSYLEQKGFWTDMANDLYDSFVAPIAEVGDTIESAFEKEASINAEQWEMLEKLLDNNTVRAQFKSIGKEYGYLTDGAKTTSEKIKEMIIGIGKEFGYITDDMDITATNFEESLSDGWFTSDFYDKMFEMTGGVLSFSDATTAGIDSILEFRKEASRLRHDPVIGVDFESWEGNLMSRGFNEKSVNVYIDAVKEAYAKEKELHGEAATITDDILDYADAMLLSYQRNANISVDAAKEITTALDAQTTSYEATGLAYEGFARIITDRYGNKIVARMEGGYYWGEALKGVLEGMSGLVEVIGESFENVFGMPTKNMIWNLSVTFYELTERFNGFVENSQVLRSVLDALFSMVKIKTIVLKGVAKGLLNVVTSIINAFTGGQSHFKDVVITISDLITAFGKWLEESNVIGETFGLIADLAGYAASAIKDFFIAITGNTSEKTGATFKKIKGGFVQAFSTIGDLISGVRGKLGEFVDMLGSMEGFDIVKIFDAFKSTVLDYIANFSGFDTLKEGFKELKAQIKEGTGIDLDAIWGTLSTIGGFGLNILNNVIHLAMKLGGIVKNLFDEFRNSTFFKANAERFKAAIQQYSMSGGIFEGLGEKFKEFKKTVADTGGFKLSNLKNIFVSFYDTIIKHFTENDALEGFKRAFIGLFDDINDRLKVFGIDIKGWFTTIKDFIVGLVERFSDFKAKIKELGGIKLNNLTSVFKAFYNTVISYFGEFEGFKSLKEGASNLIDSLLTALADFGIDIRGWFEKVGNWFGDLKAKLTELGWTEQFKNGINTIKDAIVWFFTDFNGLTAITNIVTAAWEKLTFAAGVVKQAFIVVKEAISSTFGWLLDELNKYDLPKPLQDLVNMFRSSETTRLSDGASHVAGSIKDIADAVMESGENVKKSSFLEFMTNLKNDILGVVYVLLAFKIVDSIRAIVDKLHGLDDALKSSIEKTNLLKIAVAIGILVAVIGLIASIEDVGRVWSAFGVVAASAILLFGIMVLLKKTGTLASAGIAVAMSSVAIGIAVFAGVCAAISYIPWEQFLSGLAKVVVAGVALVAALFAMSKIGPVAIGASASIFSIIGAAGLFILLSTLVGICAKHAVVMATGAGIMLVAIGILWGVSKFISKFGRDISEATTPMKNIGIFLLTSAASIFILQFVSWDRLAPALISYAAIIGGLAVIIALVNKFPAITKDSGKTFKHLAIVIGTIAAVIVGLGMFAHFMPDATLKGLGIMAAIIVGIAGIVLAFSGASKLFGAAIKDMTAILKWVTILVGVVGGIIITLTLVDTEGKALYEAISIAIVLGVIAGLLAVIGLVAKQASVATKAVPVLIMAIATLAAVAVAIGLLSNLGGENMLEAAESMALLVGVIFGIVAVMMALSPLGAALSAAIPGITMALMLIGVVVGILFITGGILGMLDTWGDGSLYETMSKGLDVLVLIFEKIGAAFGAIVGGATAKMDSYGPQVAQSAKEAADVLADINPDKFEKGIDGVKRISDLIGSIAWDSLGAGIANALGETGSQNVWELFKTRAETMADGLKGFCDKVNSIKDLTIPSDEINDLSEAIKNLPFDKESGLFGIWKEKGMPTVEEVEAFKTEATTIAGALTDFSAALPNDLDGNKVDKAASAIKSLGELGQVLKGVDLSDRTAFGERATVFDNFAREVTQLGPAIAEFSNSGINTEAILPIARAVVNIAEAIKSLAGIDLFDSSITDTESVDSATENIASLAGKLQAVAYYDFSGVDRLAAAMKAISDISLDGDLNDAEKVDAFNENLKKLSETFADTAKDYGETQGSFADTAMSLIGGFFTGGAGSSGSGGLDIMSILGGSGLDLGALTEMVGGLGGDMGDVKNVLSDLIGGGDGLNALSSLVSENGELSGGLETVKEQLGGLMADVDMDKLSSLNGGLDELTNYLSMGDIDGTISLDVVTDSGTFNWDEYANLASGDFTAGDYDLASMFSGSVDLSPLETAIDGLKSSNNSNFGELSRKLDNLSSDIISLANAINTIDLVLNTGVLVGEITPQINMALGEEMASYG